MSGICLDVVVREETGTGPARAARRGGEVPAVIYGGDLGPVAVALRKEKQTVITKDVQFHPVTDVPMHVDLYRVDKTTIIDVEVNVTFKGDDVAPGIKRGGILNVVRHAIEVSCPAGSIPDTIIVDISEMDIGDSKHISEVELPENVKPSIARDFTIATIVSSRASKEEDDETDEVEGEEGEAVEGGEEAAAQGGDE